MSLPTTQKYLPNIWCNAHLTHLCFARYRDTACKCAFSDVSLRLGKVLTPPPCIAEKVGHAFFVVCDADSSAYDERFSPALQFLYEPKSARVPAGQGTQFVAPARLLPANHLRKHYRKATSRRWIGSPRTLHNQVRYHRRPFPMDKSTLENTNPSRSGMG